MGLLAVLLLFAGNICTAVVRGRFSAAGLGLTADAFESDGASRGPSVAPRSLNSHTSASYAFPSYAFPHATQHTTMVRLMQLGTS
jgi:hypothetical protein